VDGFAHGRIATEREADIADTTRDVAMRQGLLDDAGRFDEVQRVAIVLVDAGGNRKDVGVENDVFGREVESLAQQAIGARADRNLALAGVCLASLMSAWPRSSKAITTAAAP